MADPNAEWIAKYIEAHPDATIGTICGDAVDAGVRCDTFMVSRIRQRVLARSQLDAIQQPAGVIVPHRVCPRCGGPHWISQCVVTITPVLEPATASVVHAVKPLPTSPKEPAMDSTPNRTTNEAPPLTDPGRTLTAAGTARRRQRLNEILDANPGIEPLEALAQLRSEFGIGLDVTYTYETCRVSREVHGLEPIREVDNPTRSFANRSAPVRDPAAPPQEPDEPTVDDELKHIAQQLAQVVKAHRLDECEITFMGKEVQWHYEVRRKGHGAIEVRP